MSMMLMVQAMHLKVGNPLRKLVLIKLADNANDKGECWPSHQHIADQCEIARSTVRKHIKSLAESKLLWIEYRKGAKGNSSNLYHLTLKRDMPSNDLGRQIAQGGSSDSTTPRASDSTITSNSFEPVIEPILVQPEVKPSKYKFNQYQMDFAKWMHSLILGISPNLKQPSFESWANTIRLMMENDNREGDHMASVFTWVNKDTFWSSNILSPVKFRKQYDQLVAKMNQTSRSNEPTQRTAEETQQFMDEVNDQFERSQAAKQRREARGIL